MPPIPVSLTAVTEKSNYSLFDQVKIQIMMKRGGIPAAGERIRIIVYRPTGSKVINTVIYTDNNGIALTLFQLKKKEPSGSYAVEAHSDDGSMALTSFLVI
jgi:uncharacterized protein YfaS (alpha-2-macroglobulin family)